MSPNGRRVWRRAAKKLRRKMGRRWRSQKEWLFGKRWSELVPDLEAHRRCIKGVWFKRHGVTAQGLQRFDSPHPVRVYIGLWGTADGDGVEYAVKPKPFTARSLVGKTMGARKRNGITQRLDLWDYLDKRLQPCTGCMDCDPQGFPSLCDGSGVLPARRP